MEAEVKYGRTPEETVQNSVVLEEVAFMDWHMLTLEKEVKQMPSKLLDKHFKRKHGDNAYYGQ